MQELVANHEEQQDTTNGSNGNSSNGSFAC
jgi:hypothetical protein